MSWREILTAPYLRELAGIKDNKLDITLGTYINGTIDYISAKTGLDFDFSDSEITEIIKDPEFALGRTICQIGAWQSITKIEISAKQATPNWRVLSEFADFNFKYFSLHPKPIIELTTENYEYDNYHASCCFEYNCMLRITGKKGFSGSTQIPDAIKNLFTSLVLGAYNFNKNKGVVVVSESDLNLSRGYDSSNPLNTLAIYSPDLIPQLNQILKIYKINYGYAFS